MIHKFSGDIRTFYDILGKKSTTLNTIRIPNNAQLFFESKIEEICDRYQSARIFLCEIDNDDWGHWFSLNNKDIEVVKVVYNGLFIETSLIYYNIVVDLTWVLSYVSMEYLVLSKGKYNNIENFTCIRESKDILRNLEKIVSNPTSKNNPFSYFKKIDIEYSEIIECMELFWNDFKNSKIRRTYNFIKHKGKPQYSELFNFIPKKAFSLNFKGLDIPIDPSDVILELSQKDFIKELINFDDEYLFPYCDQLIKLLKSLLY